MPIRTVGEYLARWGFTPQKPLKQAYEQRPAALEKWLKEDYVEIAKKEPRTSDQKGQISHDEASKVTPKSRQIFQTPQNRLCRIILVYYCRVNNDITMLVLQTIFDNVIGHKKPFKNPERRVIDLIFELGEELSKKTDIQVNLENKIVLSIAIRLKAELFMKSQISDKKRVENITDKQTFRLFDLYRNEPHSDS